MEGMKTLDIRSYRETIKAAVAPITGKTGRPSRAASPPRSTEWPAAPIKPTKPKRPTLGRPTGDRLPALMMAGGKGF